MTTPTREEVLTGVELNLKSMRDNAETHVRFCLDAVERAACSPNNSKYQLRQMMAAGYHAGAAQMLLVFSKEGSHTHQVWFGTHTRTKEER